MDIVVKSIKVCMRCGKEMSAFGEEGKCLECREKVIEAKDSYGPFGLVCHKDLYEEMFWRGKC